MEFYTRIQEENPMNNDNNSTSNKNLDWWRQARIGIFIHWGIYSATEGYWNGRETKGIGEWIQHRERIPLLEYSKFAQRMTLDKFNAKEWIAHIKNAGFKYIVLTAKHHEGFAMYNSECSDYNIVKMGPSHSDPARELASAANEEGLKMCFYYSQAHDWQDKDAVGNDWDFNENDKVFGRYLEGKCKHQLKELLTNYGDVGLIWFDVPQGITLEQSIQLKGYVKSLQPNCLVSGRISSKAGIGDYGSLGDNQLPKGKISGEWETPVTLNHTWGYKRDDNNWKNPGDIINLLADLLSKGVNCLINIGPKANGEIPEESLKILGEVGKWIRLNSEAIHGTSASPFLTDFDWGYASKKDNNIYLYIKDGSKTIQLNGIRNNINKIVLTSENDVEVKFEQYHNTDKDEHNLIITMPDELKSDYISVAKIELEGETDVVDYICQQPSQDIILPAYLSILHKGEKAENNKQTEHKDTAIKAEEFNIKGKQGISINHGGVIENWFDTSSSIEWEFVVFNPVTVKVELRSFAKKYTDWVGGHRVRIECNNQIIRGILKADVIPEGANRVYFSETGSNIGIIKFHTEGRYRLRLYADLINKNDEVGLSVSEIIMKRT